MATWHLPTLALGAVCAAGGPDGGDDAKSAAPAASARAERRAIDLAICLDTSGSMEGLIDAARQKLWTIVNDLALAEPMPQLRVALLTFGNDGHPAESGWVRVDQPLTEDLDAVSQRLFALTTNGGTELVGRVLAAARAELAWAPAADALKLVIVAGNESADQDAQVRYGDACRALIEQGIVVDAIYCGNPADELAPGWQDVARRADGQFAAIDQRNGTVVIATPFDAELAALSTALNDTYLPYGQHGWVAAANQRAQDANAEGCNSATAAARACSKGGRLYTCDWDLVEAVKTGKVKLADVKKEELPEKMRALEAEAQAKLVDECWAKRGELQKKIQATGQKREEHVQVELEKQGRQEEAAFDRAVRDAVRKQAAAKGFRFPPPPKAAPATPATPVAPAAPAAPATPAPAGGTPVPAGHGG